MNDIKEGLNNEDKEMLIEMLKKIIRKNPVKSLNSVSYIRTKISENLHKWVDYECGGLKSITIEFLPNWPNVEKDD